MKFIIQTTVFFFTLIIFSQCKSSQKSINEAYPFKVESATYTDWVGGVKGVRGTTIKIIVANQRVAIDSIYFRTTVIVPELKKLTNGKLQIIGNIIDKEKQELILHSNPEQEYGNKPPVKIDKNFPFQLAFDELMIGYTENKNLKYFKIKLKKEKAEMYK